MASDEQPNLLNTALNTSREAGATIYDMDGNHIAADVEGDKAFYQLLRALGESCGGDENGKQNVLYDIYQLAQQALQQQEFNALPTTKPKCYAHVDIFFKQGCKVVAKWSPRNSEEQDCGG